MLLLLLAAFAPADTVPLTPGMVITHSVVIKPSVYRFAPTAADSVMIRVKGDGIDVDFAGSMLVGAPYEAAPDRGAGIGILVEGGRNVTIRRGTIRGYKIGILVRGTADLHLLDNDVSFNWKPRLWSGLGHESLVDWLSYHHNDKDEWLRYGAGIYLADVAGGEVKGNTARQGMNGLLMVRTSKVTVAANDFSYLTGLGIGLYRSSDNRILSNRADYCIRGYSHGVYNRGQDSAALLLYEQSSRNIVAFNSMTHGGDGLFLWAGQSTMDSGVGGANDNLFFGNDFSFAATNGMEATFSRNRFIGNLIEGAQNGLWGGYSYGSEVRGNRFKGNVVGIAIEHGQDNKIVGNDFEGDLTAVKLWWNALEPSDWGYPKTRDTKSRGYAISDNRFLGNKVALALENTQKAVLLRNKYFAVDTLFQPKGDTAGFKRDARRTGMAASGLAQWRPNPRDLAAPPALPGVAEAFSFDAPHRGRAGILVDEWGPYDWKAPRAWPARTADTALVRSGVWYKIIGGPGEWSVAAIRGATVSRPTGKVGDSLVVTPIPGPVIDYDVEFEYKGEAVTTPDGAVGRAGDPYRFHLRKSLAPADWRVTVFPWDSASDPRKVPASAKLAPAVTALASRRDSILDWVWARPKLPAVPEKRFVAIAETQVELPKGGDYEIFTISDDGIRVWIDDRLAIDDWTAHESALDRADLKPGKHRIRVEYYQIDGWVELRAEIRKKGS